MAAVTAGLYQSSVSFQPYVDALYHGYNTALGRMLTEARAMGADGVVGIRLTQTQLGENNQEFVALGTAVRANSAKRPHSLFTTAAARSGRGQADARGLGAEPAGDRHRGGKPLPGLDERIAVVGDGGQHRGQRVHAADHLGPLARAGTAGRLCEEGQRGRRDRLRDDAAFLAPGGEQHPVAVRGIGGLRHRDLPVPHRQGRADLGAQDHAVAAARRRLDKGSP